MSTRIGMVGLAEAGNYGDDLIAVSVAQTIAASIPGAEIHFIGFRKNLNWDSLSAHLGTTMNVVRHVPGRDLPFSRQDESFLAECRAIVFGGGGLLQTSHHPQRPYHWLRYLSSGKVSAPVIAAGLGLGPLDQRWCRRLRAMGSPFDECFLRDDDSVKLAEKSLGWPAKRCRDFIDAEFLSQLLSQEALDEPEHGAPILGVALRAWPGLGAQEVARHVEQTALEIGAGEARFYVLEATAEGPDIRFSRKVMRSLNQIPVTERFYLGEEFLEFTQDLARCQSAISMKLHSSAVWASVGVSIYPISYAPKTAAFFGLPYQGLQISTDVVEPAKEEAATPRAQSVLGDWLRSQYEEGFPVSSRSKFSRRQRISYQSKSFVVNVKNKIRKST